MADWKQELENIFLSDSQASRAERENARFVRFLREVATPALEEIAEEMRRLGRVASVQICYSVTRQYVNDGILPRANARVVRMNSRTTNHDEPFRPEGVKYTIDDVTKEDVIRSFLSFYRMTKGQ